MLRPRMNLLLFFLNIHLCLLTLTLLLLLPLRLSIPVLILLLNLLRILHFHVLEPIDGQIQQLLKQFADVINQLFLFWLNRFQ